MGEEEGGSPPVSMDSRRICDRVYGELHLPEFVVRIAETPEFHRLDCVRQLGGCAFVYPSASHTRREHAFGVCHLAGQMGLHLAADHADVDDDDVLCLQVAGLVHDLGHGPFSHLFEDFMHEEGHVSWSHEEMGMQLLDLILERHDLSMTTPLHASADNVRFVKLLVQGLARDAPWPEGTGRGAGKRFLVDIVSNHDSGIDVDKLDYLARDALSAFGSSRALNALRIVRAARVCLLEDRPILAYDEGVAFELADVFLLRAKLHHQLYQHRAVKVVERLLCDAMHTIERDGGVLARRALRADTFAQLTDATILHEIDRRNELRTKLYRRPWCRRLDVAVRVKTLPLCAECGAETLVLDRFCGQCGTTTRARAHVRASSGLAVSPGCALTAKAATGAVRDAVRGGAPAGVVVHLTDILVGHEVSLIDPWDESLKWRAHDPLASIPFWSQSSAVAGPTFWFGMRTDPFHVPHVRHARLAHCYVDSATSDAAAAAVRSAFVEWGARVGEVVAFAD